jgi:RNA polymerase sigma-70 factor (sigma-E family)
MGKQDTEEFAAFVQSSQASLRRTAYLLCGDWQLASDHVQEGLIRVYVRWGRLERDGRLHSYARKAVVSAALDALRRRSSTELVTDTSAHDAAGTGDHASESSERAALFDALARLPQRQRACVVLRYYEDLPVAEVAELLGISEGTVKSQSSRGIAALQSAFVAVGVEGLVVS